MEFQYGCTDSTACNYNFVANISDDSCEYPEQGFDCDGNYSGPIWNVSEDGSDDLGTVSYTHLTLPTILLV